MQRAAVSQKEIERLKLLRLHIRRRLHVMACGAFQVFADFRMHRHPFMPALIAFHGVLDRSLQPLQFIIYVHCAESGMGRCVCQTISLTNLATAYTLSIEMKKCPKCNGSGRILSGWELRIFRERTGLSLSAVARRLDINKGHLSRVERGLRQASWQLQKKYQKL